MSEKKIVLKIKQGEQWVDVKTKTSMDLVENLNDTLDQKLNSDIWSKIKRFGFVDNTETTILLIILIHLH